MATFPAALLVLSGDKFHVNYGNKDSNEYTTVESDYLCGGGDTYDNPANG